MSARRRAYLPPALWAGLVAALLLLPGGALAPLGPRLPAWVAPWLDKAIHALLFAIQALLLGRGRAALGAPRSDPATPLAVGAYALVLEALQVWVPQRSFELLDLAAGLGGGALGVILAGRRAGRAGGGDGG